MLAAPATAAVTILVFYAAGTIIPSTSVNIVASFHTNLTVSKNGRPITIPSHIGMNMMETGADPSLYGDHSLDKFGVEDMSPLHTHDSSGIIHVESNRVRNYTLGDFLDIWQGFNIDGNRVSATVDGKPVTNYRDVLLKDGEIIILDIRS